MLLKLFNLNSVKLIIKKKKKRNTENTDIFHAFLFHKTNNLETHPVLISRTCEYGSRNIFIAR